jgi:hypothetical protein
LPGNRLRLHPARDPNWFYQCVPLDGWGRIGPQLRPCACGTIFSARRDDTRCVHPEEWLQDCPNQLNPPTLSREFCREECPTCDDNPGTTWAPSTTWTPPVSAPPSPTPPGNSCPCPCFPCMWFPCQPCASNCPCNHHNGNRNPPRLPPPNNNQNWQTLPQWFNKESSEIVESKDQENAE